MNVKERIARAWSQVGFGPGWEKRLDTLLEQVFEAALAEQKAALEVQFRVTTDNLEVKFD